MSRGAEVREATTSTAPTNTTTLDPPTTTSATPTIVPPPFTLGMTLTQKFIRIEERMNGAERYALDTRQVVEI